MLDEFLKEKPPQVDLLENATTAEWENMPCFTVTLPSTGFRTYAGNWREEAETFRCFVGRQDNARMLRRQVGYEVAELTDLLPFKQDTPGWREGLIDFLKQRGEGYRMDDHSSGLKDALSRSRAEFVMAAMLEMLEDGEGVPTFEFVRGISPVLSPDIGRPATHNLAGVSLLANVEVLILTAHHRHQKLKGSRRMHLQVYTASQLVCLMMRSCSIRMETKPSLTFCVGR